ncbi:MAG: succinyldiaminopimelate transaminase [Pseudomonadota bacterium]
MNPDLDLLHPYPFEKLRALFGDAKPNAALEPIALSIGEPRHRSPDFVLKAIGDNLDRVANYPTTQGLPELRSAIADWLKQRFSLPGIDSAAQVLPVNGTREALFAFAQAVIDRDRQALVMSPNPFYQIYEGAALLAGATPRFINCEQRDGFLPDFGSVTEDAWRECQLLYLCNPGNPAGAVMPQDMLESLIQKAHAYDFVIASDECYSEIYPDEDAPPPGLLQAAAASGDSDYKRCVAFHSLSKRSNLPGLRSGFVAGDADVLKRFLSYRTYHGCAMPIHHQLASISAWSDEAHVRDNRSRYREKFDAVLAILDGKLAVSRPDAGFYLWPKTPVSDEQFARDLYLEQHVTVLAGRYLARDTAAGNPGVNRVRMALVAELDQCVEAAERIANYLDGL